MDTSKSSNAFKVQPVKRTGSLSAHVADQLERMISSGSISVGQKLPSESSLCEMFDVSRTVVREAITQIKSLGLVETRRGIGTTVVRNQSMETMYAYTIDPTVVDDILNILELRISVEMAAAEYAALRRDQEDVRKIEQCIADFDRAVDSGDMGRNEDFAFHLAIINATKNPFFKKFYEQFNQNVIPRAKLLKADIDSKASAKYLERIRAEHHTIFDAIRSGKPEAARKAMHEHLYRAYHLYEKYKTDNHFD